ncbi:MAG: DUF721 domain-containing protein [Bacteroidales bacterium]|nr:DUF721 domain-containing protein [Bacteroidales bacterium]
MVKRQNTHSLGEIIQQYIRKSGIQPKLDEAEVKKRWEDIVGKMISQHTTDMYLKNRKLYIRFDSAALKQEMSYAKSTLVDNINRNIGHLVVEEVIFI